MNFYQFIESNLNENTYAKVFGVYKKPVRTIDDIKKIQEENFNNLMLELYDGNGKLLHTIGFDSETAYLDEEELLLSLN